jgi:hypothetical protein
VVAFALGVFQVIDPVGALLDVDVLALDAAELADAPAESRTSPSITRTMFVVVRACWFCRA